MFYKKLSSYPLITEWEIQSILDFIEYENINGRKCEIKADKEILNQILHQEFASFLSTRN